MSRVERKQSEYTERWKSKLYVNEVLRAWSIIFQQIDEAEAVKMDGSPKNLDLFSSKDLVLQTFSCHPPDDPCHDVGLAYEGAMSGTTSLDLAPFTDVLRQFLLNRYRHSVVILANKVCRWYDSVKTISSRWLSKRIPAMGDEL